MRHAYSEEHDAWRLHGILAGQVDAAVVDAALKLRVRRAPDGKVPLEQVVLWVLGEGRRQTGDTQHSTPRAARLRTGLWAPAAPSARA